MANEKRLIDLDKTLQRLEKEVWWTESQKSAIRLFLYKSKVKDAVEVVRCKDCKYYARNESGICRFHTDSFGEKLTMAPDDFCSYGERREGE